MVLLSCGLLCSTGISSRDSLVPMSVSSSLLSTQYYELGTNVSSGMSHTKYIFGVYSEITWISDLNFRKASPCNGLVKCPSSILLVGQYLRFRPPLAILSLIRKYMMHICFPQFPLDNLPLLFRSTELRLSWYMTTSSTWNPCASTKYLYHRNKGITLSAQISSTSVEILEFIFYLFEILATDPHPRDIFSPLRLLQYGCIAYYASTNQFIMFSLYTLSINGMWMVDLMYFITRLNFRQSSSSGLLTLLLRNATFVWIYFLTWIVVNKSCTTEWWNEVDWCSSNSFISESYLTVNMFSTAGVATITCIVSGKSETIFFR